MRLIDDEVDADNASSEHCTLEAIYNEIKSSKKPPCVIVSRNKFVKVPFQYFQ